MRTGNYKESVGQIIALSDSKAAWAWSAALIAALIVAPYLVGAYALTLMVSALIAVIGAVGLNLLTGTTGLISVGQAGFLAVGAYTNAILLTDYHLPVWISLLWSASWLVFRPCA
jgi:branched-chain amino acid transport system permease protein